MGRQGKENGGKIGGFRLKASSIRLPSSGRGTNSNFVRGKRSTGRTGALLVADTHFGKAAAFRKSGIPVPESSSAEDCQRIEDLIQRTKADSLVLLGDFLHARDGRTQIVRKELNTWREKMPNLEIHLVRGNHDLQSGDPWPELRIHCHPDPWTEFDFDLRHLPVEGEQRPFLAGHLHPGFS